MGDAKILDNVADSKSQEEILENPPGSMGQSDQAGASNGPFGQEAENEVEIQNINESCPNELVDDVMDNAHTEDAPVEMLPKCDKRSNEESIPGFGCFVQERRSFFPRGLNQKADGGLDLDVGLLSAKVIRTTKVLDLDAGAQETGNELDGINQERSPVKAVVYQEKQIVGDETLKTNNDSESAEVEISKGREEIASEAENTSQNDESINYQQQSGSNQDEVPLTLPDEKGSDNNGTPTNQNVCANSTEKSERIAISNKESNTVVDVIETSKLNDNIDTDSNGSSPEKSNINANVTAAPANSFSDITEATSSNTENREAPKVTSGGMVTSTKLEEPSVLRGNTKEALLTNGAVGLSKSTNTDVTESSDQEIVDKEVSEIVVDATGTSNPNSGVNKSSKPNPKETELPETNVDDITEHSNKDADESVKTNGIELTEVVAIEQQVDTSERSDQIKISSCSTDGSNNITGSDTSALSLGLEVSEKSDKDVSQLDDPSKRETELVPESETSTEGLGGDSTENLKTSEQSGAGNFVAATQSNQHILCNAEEIECSWKVAMSRISPIEVQVTLGKNSCTESTRMGGFFGRGNEEFDSLDDSIESVESQSCYSSMGYEVEVEVTFGDHYADNVLSSTLKCPDVSTEDEDLDKPLAQFREVPVLKVGEPVCDRVEDIEDILSSSVLETTEPPKSINRNFSANISTESNTFGKSLDPKSKQLVLDSKGKIPKVSRFYETAKKDEKIERNMNAESSLTSNEFEESVGPKTAEVLSISKDKVESFSSLSNLKTGKNERSKKRKSSERSSVTSNEFEESLGPKTAAEAVSIPKDKVESFLSSSNLKTGKNERSKKRKSSERSSVTSNEFDESLGPKTAAEAVSIPKDKVESFLSSSNLKTGKNERSKKRKSSERSSVTSNEFEESLGPKTVAEAVSISKDKVESFLSSGVLKTSKNGKSKKAKLDKRSLVASELEESLETKRKKLASNLKDKIGRSLSSEFPEGTEPEENMTRRLSAKSLDTTLTLTSIEDDFENESIISSPERVELTSEFQCAFSDLSGAFSDLSGDETVILQQSDSDELEKTVVECAISSTNQILPETEPVIGDLGSQPFETSLSELDRTLVFDQTHQTMEVDADNGVQQFQKDKNQNMVEKSVDPNYEIVPQNVTFEEGELELSVCNSSFAYSSKFLTVRIGSINPEVRSKRFVSKLRVMRSRSVFLASYFSKLNNQSIYSAPREELIKAGFLHCNRCPLIYSPKLFTCFDCDLYFEDVVARDYHYVTVHEDFDVLLDKIPLCVVCRAKFTTREEYLKHKATHYCPDHVECTFGCSTLIVGKNPELQDHLRSLHSIAPKKVILGCNSSNAATGSDLACGSNFENLILCSDCEQMAIPKDSTGFLCKKCPSDIAPTIYVFDEFLWHMQEVHQMQAKGKFRCILCPHQEDLYDNDLGELRKHRFISHTVCHKHIKCIEPACECLMSENSLLTHLTSECLVFEVDQLAKEQPCKKFEVETVKFCYDCKNVFPTCDCFKCKYCDAVFVNEKEFYAHVLFDHEVPVLVPRHLDYTCLLCNFLWSEEDNRAEEWRKHRQEVHRICKSHILCKNVKCFMVFPSTELRDQHVQNSNCRKLASAEDFSDCSKILNNFGSKLCKQCKFLKRTSQSYQCPLCTTPQVFVDNMELMIHLGIYHQVKFFGKMVCSLCRQSFTEPSLLSKHVEQDHQACKRHAFCPASGAQDCAFLHNANRIVNKKNCKCEKVLKISPVEAPAVLPKQSPKRLPGEIGCFLTCADCNFKLDFNDAMTLSSDVQCSYGGCQQKFVVRYEAEAHKILQHKVQSTAQFTCTICPQNSFRSTADVIAQHYNIAHRRCKLHQRCDNSKCFSLFRADRDISKHFKICRATVTKAQFGPTKRRIVNTAITSAPKRSMIEKSPAEVDSAQANGTGIVHLDTSKMIKCGKCPRRILSTQIFECPICPDSNSNGTFPTENDLIAHQALHHDSKPTGVFKCWSCNLGFPDNVTRLFNHLSAHHYFCGIHWVCRVCYSLFESNESLMNHVAKDHR